MFFKEMFFFLKENEESFEIFQEYWINFASFFPSFYFFLPDSATDLLQDVEPAGVKWSGSGPELMDLGLLGVGGGERDPVGQGKEQESG
jgi:hypothetical protein